MSKQPPRRRVLLLNHNSRGVGTYYRCWHLARHLVRIGYEVSLLTVSPTRRVWPQSGLQDGVFVTETPNLLTHMYALGWGYGAIGIPYRILYALDGRFDIVHSFDHKPNVLLPAILRTKLTNTPLVADWSDWWGATADGSGLQERKAKAVIRLETSMEAFIHREADWVTTISTGLMARAVSLGIPAERVAWIPSGSPSDVILPIDSVKAKENLGIPPSTFLLTHVGMGEERAVSSILPAISKLRRRRPQVRLGIIGPARIPDAFAARDVRENLVLFGRIPFDKLHLYLGASDAFVLPLQDTVVDQTRWPNKFGDYIAAARPVLCRGVGDVPAFIREEECGIVWNDSAELEDAVDRLIFDPGRASEMGERARQLAEGRLSWARIASQFSEIYSHLET